MAISYILTNGIITVSNHWQALLYIISYSQLLAL